MTSVTVSEKAAMGLALRFARKARIWACMAANAVESRRGAVK